VAQCGFDHVHLRSTFNTVEFALREFATGGSPRGLTLLTQCIAPWLYGGDPVAELRYEAAVATLKALALGPDGDDDASASAAPATSSSPPPSHDPLYFQRLVRRFLLDNPHRVTLHMWPDPAFTPRRDAAEAAALAATAAALTDADRAAIEAAQTELTTVQSTPDTASALATIPTLSLSDLPVHSKIITRLVTTLPPPTPATTPATAAAMSRRCSLLVHEQATRGIGHVSLYADAGALPAHLLPYLPPPRRCRVAGRRRRRRWRWRTRWALTRAGWAWRRRCCPSRAGATRRRCTWWWRGRRCGAAWAGWAS